MFFMICMVTMTVVHEEMHERASKKRQPDQHPQNMSSVLGKQKRACDDRKSQEDQSRA